MSPCAGPIPVTSKVHSDLSISIIVPAFNRQRLIGETLESLLRQSLPAREVIVVDDGSTDDTCKEIGRFVPRVTLLRQPQAGPGAARNAGLARASGDFIQFFDSDDLASRNLLQAKAHAIEGTQADIAYGPWLPVWLEASMCRHDGFVRQAAAVPLSPLSAFLRGWVLIIPNCLIRRRSVQRCGGYPTHLRTSEDMLLLFRLLRGGARLAYTPHSLMLVRQHPAGQISADPAGLAQRAIEQVNFTGTVLSELAATAGESMQSRPAASLRDILAWRVRHAQATSAAQTSGHTCGAEQILPGTSRRDLMMSRTLAAFHRIERALRSRLIGHHIPSAYCARPLDAAQAELIHDLGYTPQRSSPTPATHQRNPLQ